jgi:hypothetical protein
MLVHVSSLLNRSASGSVGLEQLTVLWYCIFWISAGYHPADPLQAMPLDNFLVIRIYGLDGWPKGKKGW